MVCGDQGIALNVAHFKQLLEHYGEAIPETIEQQYSVNLGPIRVVWESHAEFVTYTFSKQGAFAHPFAEPVLHDLPEQWLRELPGEVITAVSLAIDSCATSERGNDELSALFDANPVIGSRIVGGLAGAWSDFKIQPDGCVRILVRDCSLSDHQAGRLIKRILDINCYRALAMIGYPLAWKVAPRLSDADRRLAMLAARMSTQRGASRPPRGCDARHRHRRTGRRRLRLAWAAMGQKGVCRGA